MKVVLLISENYKKKNTIKKYESIEYCFKYPKFDILQQKKKKLQKCFAKAH